MRERSVRNTKLNLQLSGVINLTFSTLNVITYSAMFALGLKIVEIAILIKTDIFKATSCPFTQ